MNFGLLAEEEQDAIMYAYAGLLNSPQLPDSNCDSIKNKGCNQLLANSATKRKKKLQPHN